MTLDAEMELLRMRGRRLEETLEAQRRYFAAEFAEMHRKEIEAEDRA